MRAAAEYGITLDHEPTHLDSMRRRRFDAVISLYDRVREVCPEFPGRPVVIHWSLPDPAHEPAADGDTFPAFQQTTAELDNRIRFLPSALTTDAEESRP
ncbi:hypothetical protein [Amycolatopsis sp. NPDC051372]|uniref:hypothetical protein n=1 Tax=Amycolatopsis sp. NPDC051372 TaxID=3155669 RepID=UPI00342B29F1